MTPGLQKETDNVVSPRETIAGVSLRLGELRPQIGKAMQQRRDGDAGLETGEALAEAGVDPGAEGQVPILPAADVQPPSRARRTRASVA